jgi:hypothetical protein
MKKFFAFAALALTLIFGATVSGSSSVTPKSPFPPFIEGTAWAGNLTIVNTSGDTQVAHAELTITKQDDSFFSAQLVENLDTPITVSLSGFIGPIKDQTLHMTGVNLGVAAVIYRSPGKKKPLQMDIRGHNFADGTTFIGTLVQQ